MNIEFDYCILKNGVPSDDCYAFVEFDADDIVYISDALMECNSDGQLIDIPEECLSKFIAAAIEDATLIYPNFSDEKAGFSVMLQRFLPDDLLDVLPNELIETFSPDMFEKVE